MTGTTPQDGTTPKDRIDAERARRGSRALVAGCVSLLAGTRVTPRAAGDPPMVGGTDDPDLLRCLGGPGAEKFFDGAEHDDTYWFRVWALRGLLWCWDESAAESVCRALGDDAWRVREMAAKVVARHLVGAAFARIAELRDDPVARVRSAADRALIRLTDAEA